MDNRFTPEPCLDSDNVIAVVKGLSPEMLTPVLCALEERAPGAMRAFQITQGSVQPAEWEPIIPLGAYHLPTFPLDALPPWMRQFVEAEATRTQTPPDLAGMLVLACAALAVATTHQVCAGPGWFEPLNLYIVIALPPGSRKSAVFSSVVRPIADYEREENKRREALIAESKTTRDLLQGRLERAKRAAVDSKEEEREKKEGIAHELARDLEEYAVLTLLRLLVDDCTPEKLASLMAEQNGRIAILSPEGDTFDIIAGRYSETPNFGVYLKGHSGDELRVDRQDKNRPPEYIARPALTMGLALQPDVLQGLASKPGFRGRGLLGRFLYSLPPSNIGYRTLQTVATSPDVISAYSNGMRSLLDLRPLRDEDGNAYPETLYLEPMAQALFRRFGQAIEENLRPEGELSSLTDWGAKLAGAVARLAGILHLAEHGNTCRQISPATMQQAIRIGQYLTEHAKAAYDAMGTDADMEGARKILAWIEKTQPEQFTKRDLFQSVRGTFKKTAALDKPLAILDERGYIREEGSPKPQGAGRPGSTVYGVNPALLSRLAVQGTQGERRCQ